MKRFLLSHTSAFFLVLAVALSMTVRLAILHKNFTWIFFYAQGCGLVIGILTAVIYQHFDSKFK